VKETDPLEHTAEWSYDKAGDLSEAVDRNGSVDTFSYDALRRLTTARYGVSGLEAESSIGYEYDLDNRLTHLSDSASGEYAIARDPFGRIESLESPGGTVGYEYDAAGRRTAMSLPGSRTVSYAYDNANRLTEVSSEGKSASLAYDKADRPESLTLPDGIEQVYGYDNAGQATTITYRHGESTLGEVDYAYDPAGRTEAVWGSYARLALPEALKSAKYNAANEMIEREGEALSYDADGNLVADSAKEYSWNARDQLTEISGATIATSGYDPFGRRISKSLGSTTTHLLYDGANVAQESVGGSVTANLLSGLTADELFARTTAEGTDSYLSDKLGSVIGLANGSGEVDTTYTYDPFGGSTAAGEPTTNPYQFTGRENDGTGLQYNRARYYSPESGRFVSQDPMGFAGSGPNLYWYAYSDSVDFTDPSGECIPFCPPNPIDVVEDGIHKVGEWVSGAPGVISKVDHVVLDIAAVPPYAIYYGSYEAAKGINSLGSHLGAPGRIVAHTVNGPLVGAQVAGLGADAGIDYIKGHTVNEEPVGDEGAGSEVHLNPFHEFLPGLPDHVIRNAPGIGPDGHIDIEG